VEGSADKASARHDATLMMIDKIKVALFTISGPGIALEARIVEAHSDGGPCEPVLVLTNKQSDDTIRLTRRQAWQLRELIDQM
jgi:hypothetical protein